MNIEKYKMHSRVKELYFKHNGKFRYIAEDLTKELGRDVDMKYVYYIVDKIKKSVSLESLYEAMNVIVPNIMRGHESRAGHLYKILRGLDNLDKVLVSACCKVPVTEVPGVNGSSFYCVKCKEKTEPMAMVQAKEIELIQSVVKSLQQEDESIVRSLDTLRGDKKEHELGQIQQQQVNVHLHTSGRGKKAVVLTKENQKVVEDMKNMPPQDREKIIKKIEAELVDAKLAEMGFEDKDPD